MRPYDLMTPDGKIVAIEHTDKGLLKITVSIEEISPWFRGFYIDEVMVKFNLKSTFAQLGVDVLHYEIKLSRQFRKASVLLQLKAFNPIGAELLRWLEPGCYVGKLFAEDPERRVHNPDYLLRLIGKTDWHGNPLLLLSEEYKTEEILHQPHKDRTIVRVPLRSGYWIYDDGILGFIRTIAKGLLSPDISFRRFLQLHQIHVEKERKIPPGKMLFTKTMSMNIQTLFAKVVHDELPAGFKHAHADIIQPQIRTGDIFEFHGESGEEITHVPLEFYTLEPFREYFSFSDRTMLKETVQDQEKIFKAFTTAPPSIKAATFIVKRNQLLNLSEGDWIQNLPRESHIVQPAETRAEKWALQNFIENQCTYPILKAMQEESITSEGIILCTHFVSPCLIQYLLSERVRRTLSALYFCTPSEAHGQFFSHDDRQLLQELYKAGIDIFWVDASSHLLLKYVMRRDRDYGMFVPLTEIDKFNKGTFFGIYGSKMIAPPIQEELKRLFEALKPMKHELDHFKLNPDTEIVIVTGGGPGVMAMGNQLASELGLLSCGHAVDFRKPHEIGNAVREKMNPFIQAKMTYRLEQVIVRQSEFNLDFPIFLTGGVGTDFELALELLRLQVGIQPPVPILLVGEVEYWKEKVTLTFQNNLRHGTIHGSEWVSNCLFCVQNHKQALSVYYKFFNNRLEIGPGGKPHENGFVILDSDSDMYSQ